MAHIPVSVPTSRTLPGLSNGAKCLIVYLGNEAVHEILAILMNLINRKTGFMQASVVILSSAYCWSGYVSWVITVGSSR